MDISVINRYKNELIEKMNQVHFNVVEYKNPIKIVVMNKNDKSIQEFDDYEAFLDEFGIFLL